MKLGRMSDSKPKILVIDEAQVELLDLGIALEGDYEIRTATSSKLAVDLALSEAPDLLLINIDMPNKYGFRTYRKIKSIARLANVPVIFATAGAEIESVPISSAVGSVDYIHKPVIVRLAKKRIQNLLEREYLQRESVAQCTRLVDRVRELDKSKSELLKAQADLVEREAYLSAIILSEPVCIKTVDEHGNLLTMNPAGLEMIEADSINQVVGRSVIGLIAPDYRTSYADLHSRVVRGESGEMEFEVVGLKGGRRWLETHGVPLPLQGKNIHLAVSRDITSRKENQQYLELVLGEQRAMLENEIVGIVKTRNRNIVWTNPAFSNMLGYRVDELVGSSTRQNFPSQESYEDLAAKAYPTFAKGGIFRSQIEHVRKDGRKIWVEINGSALDGRSGECLWSFVDITDRKRVEQELQRQIKFGNALNALAKITIEGENVDRILEATTRLVGETLELDRSLVYEVEYSARRSVGLCEWLNPAAIGLKPGIGVYDLDVFKNTFADIQRTQRYQISHIDDVNYLFISDKSDKLLHGEMGIQSLIWFPFNFREGACNLLVLIQVHSRRLWSDKEIEFIEAVSRQVSIGLTKIYLIDEQRKALQKLELAASVFTHTREGITITTPNGEIVDVNAAFSRITGYTRDEVIGKNPRILNSGRQSATFYKDMWRQIAEKGYWTGELWNRRKDGDIYAEMLTITSVKGANNVVEHCVAIFSDITAFKEHANQLDRIAHYDALTNLPNRVLLADRLQQGMLHEIRNGKKLAVVFIDLDGFKFVNDTYGHAAGDQLLVSIASRMKQCLREGDTLSRIGGDEFVAVLRDLDNVASSVALLTRMLNAAAQPALINDAPLQVSASFGVTYYPQAQDVEADQLLRQADQAMYQAKLAGKNRYCFFDAEQDSGIRNFHEGIVRMRQGLEKSEFVMYYQPKVNMLTGEVFGAEALIRWQHPDQGLLAPGKFLPSIENHSFAVELGEWVIDTVLSQIESWKREGVDIVVSINVGARHLQMPNFVLRLKEILSKHPSVSPSSLEIEILETSALEDLARVSQVIEDCNDLGVLFSMDDFGTGYSSLTYLRHLKVSHLKIDQSFVRNMLDDADDLTILQGVIGLAKSFRRNAIAEGVETLEHGTLLLRLGCELAQGYGIARPMPARDFPEWKMAWRPDARWSEQRVIAPEDLPLLYAGIEHRAWIAAMGNYLRGERTTPPDLNLHHCKFGKWFDQCGQVRYGALASTIAHIGRLHAEVHSLGSRLVVQMSIGMVSEAMAMYQDLISLRDQLLVQLDELADSMLDIPPHQKH